MGKRDSAGTTLPWNPFTEQAMLLFALQRNRHQPNSGFLLHTKLSHSVVVTRQPSSLVTPHNCSQSAILTMKCTYLLKHQEQKLMRTAFHSSCMACNSL